MLMIADQRFRATQMIQQLEGAPGILGRHQIHLRQDSRGPQGDIFQVPDGRSHHVEFTFHSASLFLMIDAPRLRRIAAVWLP